MEFVKTDVLARLLVPPAYEDDVHLIERRYDPLTGAQCRINARRAARVSGSMAVTDLTEFTSKPPTCPFCPENLEESTPRFPESFCAQGRIKVGECSLFPNLFPLAGYHAAATLCAAHFLDLDGFGPDMVADSLEAAKEYLGCVKRSSGHDVYPIYLWNHLPPSAASVVHPHVQVLADGRPTPYQQRLIDASSEYCARTGRSFWTDIVEEEKRRGERYIWGGEWVTAIASFAPQGNREIQVIFKGAVNLADLTRPQMAEFGRCVVTLLRGYSRMGVNSFNLCLFSGPLGQRPDHYSLHAKLISRPVFQPYYRNDTGILERFHYEADIETMPEVVAENMVSLFQKGAGAQGSGVPSPGPGWRST